MTEVRFAAWKVHKSLSGLLMGFGLCAVKGGSWGSGDAVLGSVADRLALLKSIEKFATWRGVYCLSP